MALTRGDTVCWALAAREKQLEGKDKPKACQQGADAVINTPVDLQFCKTGPSDTLSLLVPVCTSHNLQRNTECTILVPDPNCSKVAGCK